GRDHRRGAAGEPVLRSPRPVPPRDPGATVGAQVRTQRELRAVDPGEIVRLRTALRDLVALSTVPAAWVGREPPAIAAGLADVLVGSLHLDFAFVRLCDPYGGGAVDVMRGQARKSFSEWLQPQLGELGRLSRKEIVRDVGGGEEPYCGIVAPIGVNGDGGLVAVASGSIA